MDGRALADGAAGAIIEASEFNASWRVYLQAKYPVNEIR